MSFDECLFRVDASIDIGTGHVRRCLTLADAMRQRGKKITFITREHEGNLIEEIRKRNHAVIALPHMSTEGLNGYEQWLACEWEVDLAQTVACIENEDALLIIDHYGIDQRWESAVRPYINKIMVIDDLANRSHDCDFLLDQNISADINKYKGLVPSACRMLLGTTYCLLRDEFRSYRKSSLERRERNRKCENILITLGGVDKDNVTYSIIKKVKSLSCFNFKVVVGSYSKNYYDIIELVKNNNNFEIIVNAENMAELMVESDICIGAAGGTTWERCCLGLPTIQLVIADNQREIAKKLSDMGAVKYLDLNDNNRLLELIKHSEEWMSEASSVSSLLVDGNGVLRILEDLENE